MLILFTCFFFYFFLFFLEKSIFNLKIYENINIADDKIKQAQRLILEYKLQYLKYIYIYIQNQASYTHTVKVFFFKQH